MHTNDIHVVLDLIRYKSISKSKIKSFFFNVWFTFCIQVLYNFHDCIMYIYMHMYAYYTVLYTGKWPIRVTNRSQCSGPPLPNEPRMATDIIQTAFAIFFRNLLLFDNSIKIIPFNAMDSMGKLQWEDGIRNFSFLRGIMTILRQTVTFTF